MYVHRGERVAHHLKRAWSSRAGAGVEVHTLDDLNRVVERALLARRRELPAAQAVVRVEVARFTEWLPRRGDLRDRDTGQP